MPDVEKVYNDYCWDHIKVLGHPVEKEQVQKQGKSNAGEKKNTNLLEERETCLDK